MVPIINANTIYKWYNSFKELAVSDFAFILSPDFKIILAPTSINSSELPPGIGASLISSVSFDEFSIATVTLIEDVVTLTNLIPTTVSKEFDWDSISV